MNTETAIYIYSSVIPDAMKLLPGRMDRVEAYALILAIGFQESGFQHRRQIPNGPANSFFQFEKSGVTGVMQHPVSRSHLVPVLEVLQYEMNAIVLYEAIQHNDVLAVIFARLLLWTVPGALPTQNEEGRAWNQYLSGWRPGKPHPGTWEANFREAWRIVREE